MTTYPLATVFPPLRRVGKLPLSRDQVMLLMMAINEVFLAIDIYLAHNISGTIRPISGPCPNREVTLPNLR